MFKVDLEDRIQCGLVYQYYLVIASKYMYTQLKKDKSKYGNMVNMIIVSIFKHITIESKILKVWNIKGRIFSLLLILVEKSKYGTYSCFSIVYKRSVKIIIFKVFNL